MTAYILHRLFSALPPLICSLYFALGWLPPSLTRSPVSAPLGPIALPLPPVQGHQLREGVPLEPGGGLCLCGVLAATATAAIATALTSTNIAFTYTSTSTSTSTITGRVRRPGCEYAGVGHWVEHRSPGPLHIMARLGVGVGAHLCACVKGREGRRGERTTVR